MFKNKNYIFFILFIFCFICYKKNTTNIVGGVNTATPPHILFKDLKTRLESVLRQYDSEERSYKEGDAIMEDTTNFLNAMNKLTIIAQEILALEEYRKMRDKNFK